MNLSPWWKLTGIFLKNKFYGVKRLDDDYLMLLCPPDQDAVVRSIRWWRGYLNLAEAAGVFESMENTDYLWPRFESTACSIHGDCPPQTMDLRVVRV